MLAHLSDRQICKELENSPDHMPAHSKYSVLQVSSKFDSKDLTYKICTKKAFIDQNEV